MESHKSTHTLISVEAQWHYPFNTTGFWYSKDEGKRMEEADPDSFGLV